MNDVIEAAVKAMAKKTSESTDQDQALKYSQSVLNLTNALRSLEVNAK